MQFDGDQAHHLVFDCAGTRIQFTDKAPYNILVYARATNQTELFQWSEKRVMLPQSRYQTWTRHGSDQPEVTRTMEGKLC